MEKLTAEKCRQFIISMKSEKDRNQLSITGEYQLQALEIALPVLEQQGGWISCSERMPPSKTGVLVGCQYGYEWATKWATLIHGHPDASKEGWLIPGASWVPTHWHELPAPPQPSTTPQIDNDGWIEWGGGECPVSSETEVEVRMRDGYVGIAPADTFRWKLAERDQFPAADIIAYRVIENDGREG